MKIAVVCVSFILFNQCSLMNGVETPEPGRDIFPGKKWERVEAAKSKWSAPKLDAAGKLAQRHGVAALVVVEHGKIVYEMGKCNEKYRVHSIRKQFLSALYGIHVHLGTVDINDTVDELGVKDRVPLTDTEKKATLKDLLKSRSGIYLPSAATSWNSPSRGSYEPGTHWHYNNWDFNVAQTILEKKVKKRIFDEFKLRIADPIGMETFSVDDCYYVGNDSISLYRAGFYRMSAYDMARFGLLYCRNGKWKDRRIIPAAWMKESLYPYSHTYHNNGFGYLWWVARDGECLPYVDIEDSNMHYASGFGGHYILVIPSLDVVIVQRVDTNDGSPLRKVSFYSFGDIVDHILDARMKK